jgi:hypothetical protein
MSLDDTLKAGERVLEAADEALEAAGAPPAERRHRGPDRRKRARKDIHSRTACPACGCLLSRICDPRKTLGYNEGATYWRVRECRDCKSWYTTEEITRNIVPRPGRPMGLRESA